MESEDLFQITISSRVIELKTLRLNQKQMALCGLNIPRYILKAKEFNE